MMVHDDWKRNLVFSFLKPIEREPLEEDLTTHTGLLPETLLRGSQVTASNSRRSRTRCYRYDHLFIRL